MGIHYRERLLPRWWAWLVSGAMVAMLAIAYGGALGLAAGVAVGTLGGALVGWLLWITSPEVAVDAAGLHAAGAVLPPWALGPATVLDRAGVARQRGPGSDARLYVVLRPWSAARGVLVEVRDPQDPHPAWLVSSRRPELLAAAVTVSHGDTLGPNPAQPTEAT
ncbi:MAG: DUF3093 domain-containing protein [Actinomycetota bacterium]|nr:DUF3093 domain-containing protein [Actinomycetota bacterium]